MSNQTLIAEATLKLAYAKARAYREIGISEPPYAVARRKILGGGLDTRADGASPGG